MNLKNLLDKELLQQTEGLVTQEREVVSRILDHLREIESRRLFAKLGFSSLFEFCTQQLKYCPASAQLRIDAMRLARDLPEVKEALETGSVSLSSLGILQKQMRQEKRKFSPEEKRALFQKIEGKSKPEAERVLVGIFKRELPQESSRRVGANETELRMVVTDEVLAMLEKVKFKMGGNPNLSEVLEHALRKSLGIPRAAGPRRAVTSSGEVTVAAAVNPTPRRPYIPVKTRRAVAERADHRCTYISPISGRRCECKLTEFEHIVPFAKGGTEHPGNLSLLCPAHNRLRAIETYGPEKMAKYLRPQSAPRQKSDRCAQGGIS